MAVVLPDLRDGSCQVWWAHRSHFRPSLVDLLDPVERGRLLELRRVADQERFVLGCAMLRRVLGHQLGIAPTAVRLERACPDCDRPHGKVRTSESGLVIQLSVSHSGDRVATAFCHRHQVGVDVEAINPGLDTTALAPLTLTDRETLALNGLELHVRPTAFAAWWVRKEAVLKATGDGLRITPRHVDVLGPTGIRVLGPIGANDRLRSVYLHDLNPGRRYVAALAVLSEEPVDVRDLDAAELLATL